MAIRPGVPRRRRRAETDLRVFHAALEGARLRARVAKWGISIAVCCFLAGLAFSVMPAVQITLIALSLLILLGAGLPYWAMRCPKCRGNYHTRIGLRLQDEGPPPCGTCGFDFEDHFPRYGRPWADPED